LLAANAPAGIGISKAGQPAQETLQLLEEGRSFAEIAQIRSRKLSTVVAAVAELVDRGQVHFRSEWIRQDAYRQIADAIHKLGAERLKPIKEALPEDTTYEEIRLVAAHLRRQPNAPSPNALQDRGPEQAIRT
jgi:uncharacterized protein YpbB